MLAAVAEELALIQQAQVVQPLLVAAQDKRAQQMELTELQILAAVAEDQVRQLAEMVVQELLLFVTPILSLT
jgi:hypothetical protein